MIFFNPNVIQPSLNLPIHSNQPSNKIHKIPFLHYFPFPIYMSLINIPDDSSNINFLAYPVIVVSDLFTYPKCSSQSHHTSSPHSAITIVHRMPSMKYKENLFKPCFQVGLNYHQSDVRLL